MADADKNGKNKKPADKDGKDKGGGIRLHAGATKVTYDEDRVLIEWAVTALEGTKGLVREIVFFRDDLEDGRSTSRFVDGLARHLFVINGEPPAQVQLRANILNTNFSCKENVILDPRVDLRKVNKLSPNLSQGWYQERGERCHTVAPRGFNTTGDALTFQLSIVVAEGGPIEIFPEGEPDQSKSGRRHCLRIDRHEIRQWRIVNTNRERVRLQWFVNDRDLVLETWIDGRCPASEPAPTAGWGEKLNYFTRNPAPVLEMALYAVASVVLGILWFPHFLYILAGMIGGAVALTLLVMLISWNRSNAGWRMGRYFFLQDNGWWVLWGLGVLACALVAWHNPGDGILTSIHVTREPSETEARIQKERRRSQTYDFAMMEKEVAEREAMEKAEADAATAAKAEARPTPEAEETAKVEGAKKVEQKAPPTPKTWDWWSLTLTMLLFWIVMFFPTFWDDLVRMFRRVWSNTWDRIGGESVTFTGPLAGILNRFRRGSAVPVPAPAAGENTVAAPSVASSFFVQSLLASVIAELPSFLHAFHERRGV